MSLFKKYGVMDYLDACFNVLHTTGRAYIVDDIDMFIYDQVTDEILDTVMDDSDFEDDEKSKVEDVEGTMFSIYDVIKYW